MDEAARRSIVFAEAEDPRVRQAAAQIRDERLIEPVFVAPPGADRSGMPAGVRIASPEGVVLERAARFLAGRRSSRGMSDDEALRAAQDPLVFSNLLVALGEADGSVAGAVATTGDVVRAALLAIGPRPGVSRISGAFLMEFPDERPPLVFADGAVNPEPTPTELAETAMLTARTAQRLLGLSPRLAFLSFSTRGSAGHARARKMAEAAERLQTLCPELPADGELQVDAALVPEVAAVKAPGSPVGGKANVLIFPDLDSANIGYKLVERLAGASATGPILQGLAAPANDLSRGASVADIVRLAHLTARAAGCS